MRRLSVARASVAVFAGITLCAGLAWAQGGAAAPGFTIRKVDEQVVLYTLYRGPYDRSGEAVGKLFALAGQRKIEPRGPVSYAYLNNPSSVEKEHLLTEIRIPVDRKALDLAGKLGEFSDVKVIKAHEAAVTVKPEGRADVAAVYSALTQWIGKQGYVLADSPCETFLGDGKKSYAEMRTEIEIPVAKPAGTK